ncbi:uncharacterized protein [Triticum aestivum]|uniref:uncharacterized protein n=1 Tax=Triticum aestivum TaxID=4565 RepID=UPI001D0122DF|nr:uncharacterized protein LOC123185078 [Triticum aestivum]
MAVSFQKAPSLFPIEPRQYPQNSSMVREKSGAREMDGRNLLGDVGGAARTNQNKTKVIKIAVPVLAMLLLLTTAAVSTTPDDRACLRAYFRRDMFLVFCVFVSTTTGCLLAWMAVMAPTEASRCSYAWATVRCFALLAINLYFALSNLPDVDDAA